MNAMQLGQGTHTAQALSPRMQHAVRLLQMSSQEFSDELSGLLGSNPFLEAGEPDEESPSPQAERMDALGEHLPDAVPEPDAAHEAWQDDREPWQSEPGRSAQPASGGEISALDLSPAPVGLRQHLRSQLDVLRLEPRDRLLAALVAESIDDDGYLRTPLDELAAVAGLEPMAEPEEMQIALRRVQALDPLGVGARSVAECLLLQLPLIACPNRRALAGRVVTQHLSLLASRDVPSLARRLKVDVAEAQAVCAALRQLQPRPGWIHDASRIDYVVPDVLARKVRGQWQVQLNPAVMPRVQINQTCAELFQRHRVRGAHGELAGQLQEARWTLRNIQQRFHTILVVAKAIVRRQRHYLDMGPMAMKPLGLREIAEEVGMHESTVSRVTSNKYLATPNGVVELKYFFSRAMTSANGSACSGTAIRGLVGELIAAESPHAPLSDAEIARQLASQGLAVARRTVTKYRQMLHLEPVERRRRHA